MTWASFCFFLKNPFYTFLRIKGATLNLLSQKLNVEYLDSEKTVEYIIKNRISVGRIGDGEMLIIAGRDQYFQKNDKLLKEKLSKLKTTKSFLLCLPIISLTNTNNYQFEPREVRFWNDNRKYFLYKYTKIANKSKLIGETFISRFYSPYKEKNKDVYIKLLKNIWNNKDVIFVEGYYSRLGVGNDLFSNATSIKRILCPAENAFDKYDQIITYITDHISKDKLLILALGPTATVLAYDLSELGYWALDLGHIDIEYEWYKTRALNKIVISGKYCGEVNTNYPDDDNKDIEDQILVTI